MGFNKLQIGLCSKTGGKCPFTPSDKPEKPKKITKPKKDENKPKLGNGAYLALNSSDKYSTEDWKTNYKGKLPL